MAFPNDTRFPVPLQLISAQCKILGSPARLQILDLLTGQELHVKDLTGSLPLTQGTVSAHLRKLRGHSFVRVTEHGLYNMYGVRLETLRNTIDDLNELLRYLQGEGELVIRAGERIGVQCRHVTK